MKKSEILTRNDVYSRTYNWSNVHDPVEIIIIHL